MSLQKHSIAGIVIAAHGSKQSQFKQEISVIAACNIHQFLRLNSYPKTMDCILKMCCLSCLIIMLLHAPVTLQILYIYVYIPSLDLPLITGF
jgi:hypothetical protein